MPRLRTMDKDDIVSMIKRDSSGESLDRVETLVRQAHDLVEESGVAPDAVSKLRAILAEIEATRAGSDCE